MNNQLLSLLIKELNAKKYDAYYLPLSNEHLHEFTMSYENYLVELTGFTGDTGSLLVLNNKAYLYVDGRFTVQAKKEVKDKRIKIVEIGSSEEKTMHMLDNLRENKKVVINPRIISIKKAFDFIDCFNKCNNKIVFDDKFFSDEFRKTKEKSFILTKAPLFLLDKKYVSLNPKQKISEVIKSIKEEYGKSFFYLTSSLEEIAYITNLRYKFCDIDNHNVLFNSFMIIGEKSSVLYISDYLDDKTINYLNRCNIEIKNYEDFYVDLKKYKNIILDNRINNYYIYKCLALKGNSNFIETPLDKLISIKGKKEIDGLKKCNILDGVALTKVIYELKNNFKKNNFKNEYDIKKLVDKMRVAVGKKYYLCPSFETIVAYKENSAICHYVPSKRKSKKVEGESLLLIDSGGNYLCGTTDVTRTISLYKGKVPSIVKKHYSMVLNSMISLSMQKFPYGISGMELDIVARKNLYNEYLDYEHGTGHGIGYISNVHEGPNRISVGVSRASRSNILEINQLTSNEPALYFEGRYGIRIENDLLTVKEKSNKYADFLGFKTLTLCPYDMDLIDKKYLDEKVISYLNEYNKMLYNKLAKYLSREEKLWLKKETRKV